MDLQERTCGARSAFPETAREAVDRRTAFGFGPVARTVAMILSTKMSDRSGGDKCLVAVIMDSSSDAPRVDVPRART